MPRIAEGYVARITDEKGVVKYTQTMTNGAVEEQFGPITYPGDATAPATNSGTPAGGQSPASGQTKPWWRFW